MAKSKQKLKVGNGEKNSLNLAHAELEQRVAELTRANAALQAEIAHRKQVEEELRAVQFRLDIAVRGSNVGIWEIDMPDGVYRTGRGHFINVWEQLGYEPPPAPIAHATWQELWHPDDRERVERAVLDYLEGKTKDFEVEYRVLHKNGSYRWVLSRGVALRDANGRPVRFTGTRVDITDHKNAQEALHRSEDQLRKAHARLKLAVRSANVGIWEIEMSDGDYETGRSYFTHIWEQHGFPLPADSTSATSWLELLHPDDRERIHAAILSYLRGQSKEYDVEYRIQHKDGTYHWLLSRGMAVRDANGVPLRFTGSRVDITDLKRIEAALREAKETAEAANRAKSEFLANVSHEIRTPMNAILGMTELTLDTPLSDEQRKYLSTVKASADALLDVINDLLDFAKIEAGRLELDPDAFSLRTLVNETLRALALRAHKKGLELVCNIDSDVPDALFGDAGRLRQILLNLIGNAIKFTEQGEVVVRVKTHGSAQEPDVATISQNGTDDAVKLYFCVRDTGIGIAADKQQKIFQAFEQADNSTTRRYGGTGLGLSIASRLVDLMGGRITVESELGQGSIFRFAARFGRRTEPSDRSAIHPPDLKGLPVLIIDDSATSRRLLEEWLRYWQAEPTAIGCCFEALNTLWRAKALGKPYSLVLLDAKLAGKDGLLLAAKIRQSPELAETRIVLLAPEDLRGDSARYGELGIAAAVMKPVQQEELLETIDRVVFGQEKTPRHATAVEVDAPTVNGAVPPLPPLRVLIAEDNPFNQEVVEYLLQRAGHTVKAVADGRAALTALDNEAFDLLLLDVHMPLLDGFQVIEELRQRERGTGRHMPVVALTARSMKGDRERFLAAGMDEYLAKPIRTPEFFAAIQRVVAAQAQNTPAASAKPNAGSQRPPANSPCPMSADSLGNIEEGELLDRPRLLATSGGDGVLLNKMIKSFLANIPGHLTSLGAAVRERNAAQVREAAHKLCGLVSAFSASAAQSVSALEQMGATEQLEGLSAEYHNLTSIVDKLKAAVKVMSVDSLRNDTSRT
jgi:PAS domain S-box-containing protein